VVASIAVGSLSSVTSLADSRAGERCGPCRGL